jgi:hypothetical protein
LSSWTAALKVRSLVAVNLRPSLIDLVTSRRGMAARSAMDNAVYSDSIVDVAIQGCNLEHHITEQPITSIIKPVLDFTESGFVPSSVPQPLAKAAST